MTLEEFLTVWNDSSPTLEVHTSGSTGAPKKIVVEKRRMAASARITCDFLGLQQGDTALLCMPLDYIAGKMMVVRSITCGLRLISVPPSSHPLASLGKDVAQEPIGLAAMVPMQVYYSLHVAEERERLMQVRHLLIGGGAVDAVLEEQLQSFPNSVWSTYGMTETLSHIALRRLNGTERSEWYQPFSGVELSLDADGCLVIDAPAVCAERLTTNDRAQLRRGDEGRVKGFRILGRRDNVVCSGGIKIQIEEVEQRLRAHMRVPFFITKAPDAALGEQLVMLTEGGDEEQLRQLCRQHLPRYWQPRRFLQVSQLPFTETGKPARAAAEQLARQKI